MFLVLNLAIIALLALQLLPKSLNTLAIYAVAGLGLALSIAAIVISFISHKNRPATTEEKTIANELSAVANRSELIINSIGDGVMSLDGQGSIELINPAAQKLLGWGKEEAMNLNYKSIIKLLNAQGQPVDGEQDPILEAMNTNQEYRTNNLTINTKSDQKFYTSIVVSPKSEQAGQGVILTFRDITKEVREEREQAEFISTASHEMRTPVASINGFLGLALNPKVSQIDAKARDFLTKAQAATEHLGRLFQDLLDVAKTEDGRITNVPKVLDIVPFVGEIVQGLTPKAEAKNLRINYLPNSTMANSDRTITPVIYTNLDNDHLREVTDNLIENAIKYTLRGEVTVNVSTSGDDKVLISVKDSGIGIPAEDIPHLFQKFYRVDSEEVRANQIGGTGLGLYLSRRLVEMMGGRMWVESEYKTGSTFFVELPRIDSAQAETLKSEQANRILPASQTPTNDAPVGKDGMPPVVAAPPIASQSADQPRADLGSEGAQAADYVPRGEVLSREAKAAYVAKLQAMAKNQTSQTDSGQNGT